MSKLVTTYLEQIYDTTKVTKKVNVSGGIIFKEQRNEKPALLLIQRAVDDHWPLFWEFPRGKCDNGASEDLLKCMKREVKEETGLDVTPLKFIDKFQYTADKGTRLSTQFNFLCKLTNPEQEPKLSEEHQRYKWITTVGEAELMVLPEMKKSIAKAFSLLDPDGQIFNNPLNNFTPNGHIEEALLKTPMQQTVGVAAIAGGLGYAIKKSYDKAKKIRDAKKKNSKQNGHIEEGAGTAAALVVGGTLTAAALYKLKIRRQCKKLYPDDKNKQSVCRNLPSWKRKKL